ncbi:hypothetical protein ACFX15_013182 [Malus domestica]
MEDKTEYKREEIEKVQKEERFMVMKTKDVEPGDLKEEKTEVELESKTKEIDTQENVKESKCEVEEETQKDEGKEGKEKKDKEKKVKGEKGEKGEKKRKVDKKDKGSDVVKLKQKLEKINGKIEGLLETKSDIMRQIKEAESASPTVAEKPTEAAA